MNIVEGTLKSGKATLSNGAKIKTKSKGDGAVYLGIRPEHVSLDPKGALELVVSTAEPLGANTLVHGRLVNNKDAFTASIQGVYHLSKPGEKLRLSIEPENVHVFNKETGMRQE